MKAAALVPLVVLGLNGGSPASRVAAAPLGSRVRAGQTQNWNQAVVPVAPRVPTASRLLLLLPRGGASRTTPTPATSTTTALHSLVQAQLEAAQDRRRWYQENGVHLANFCECSLWYPLRLLHSLVAAFFVAELVEFGQTTTMSGNTRNEITSRVQTWWRMGRQRGVGLFSAQTWQQQKQHNRHATLQKAWDRQFSRKYQCAMGVAVGLIASPLVWTLSSLAGWSYNRGTSTVAAAMAAASSASGDSVAVVLLGAAAISSVGLVVVALLEVNHMVGERFELLLRRYLPKYPNVSRMWGELDVACETARGRVHQRVAAIPTWSSVGALLPPKRNKRSTKQPQQAIVVVVPIGMQQGVLLGAVLGVCAGV
jgi:hypothetical protein